LYGQDRAHFVSLVQTNMNNMRQPLGPVDGLMLVANALGVETGPCAFLSVTPSMFRTSPMIEVIHCTRQYMLPPSTPNAAADPLQHRTLLINGDMAHGQLPQILLEPTNGLPAHFQETSSGVPTDAAIQAFYQTHPASELMPSRTATTNKNVCYFTYIPQAWVPAFIGGNSPKTALH
jgi:hypothetical protein